jgi:hypothetical protein
MGMKSWPSSGAPIASTTVIAFTYRMMGVEGIRLRCASGENMPTIATHAVMRFGNVSKLRYKLACIGYLEYRDDDLVPIISSM